MPLLLIILGISPQLFSATPGQFSIVLSTTLAHSRAPNLPAAGSATFLVNDTADDADLQPGDAICATAGGRCTLRAAIQEANLHPGPDTIAFSLTGNGINTIQLSSHLPPLSDQSGPTTIDGYTQAGAVPNSAALTSNATILVQVKGRGAGQFKGLTITSPGNVIRGLALFDLRHAIVLSGSNARENIIAGNFIGTDAIGSHVADFEHFASAIILQQGASHNRIGGRDAAERNIISGSACNGVALYDQGTSNNLIINNIIGLGPDGRTAVPNARHGVDINLGASQNVVGGLEQGERNVISGNGWSGVEVSHGQQTSDNLVIGNFIGTDVTGTRATLASGNAQSGVNLEDSVSYTIVSDNVIGSNRAGGVTIKGFTEHNQLLRNRIGVSLDGSLIPNGVAGVQLSDSAKHSLIGPDNIIAYNPVGVRLLGKDTDFNTITRNAIFGNTTLGIDITPSGTVRSDRYLDGPNQLLAAPILIRATSTTVLGHTCASCTVELFQTDRQTEGPGQGKTLIASAVAGADGVFAVAVEGVLLGDYLTATATDSDGNTSGFAPNHLVGLPTFLPLIMQPRP